MADELLPFYMSTQNNLKRRYDQTDLENDSLNVVSAWPRHLVVQCPSDPAGFRKMSPFVIEKTLQGLIGKNMATLSNFATRTQSALNVVKLTMEYKTVTAQ